MPVLNGDYSSESVYSSIVGQTSSEDLIPECVLDVISCHSQKTQALWGEMAAAGFVGTSPSDRTCVEISDLNDDAMNHLLTLLFRLRSLSDVSRKLSVLLLPDITSMQGHSMAWRKCLPAHHVLSCRRFIWTQCKTCTGRRFVDTVLSLFLGEMRPSVAAVARPFDTAMRNVKHSAGLSTVSIAST